MSIYEFVESNELIKIIIFWGGLIGWIIGVIASITEIKNAIKRKSWEEKTKDMAFGLSDLKIEIENMSQQKTFTEKQLEQLLAKVKVAEAKNWQLQRDMESIPNEARKVYLLEQQASIISAIESSYGQYIEVEHELKQIDDMVNPQPSYEPEIEDFIKKNVQPLYIKRQKRIRLTIIASVIVIIALVLPKLVDLVSPITKALFYPTLQGMFSCFSCSENQIEMLDHQNGEIIRGITFGILLGLGSFAIGIKNFSRMLSTPLGWVRRWIDEYGSYQLLSVLAFLSVVILFIVFAPFFIVLGHFVDPPEFYTSPLFYNDNNELIKIIFIYCTTLITIGIRLLIGLARKIITASCRISSDNSKLV